MALLVFPSATAGAQDVEFDLSIKNPSPSLLVEVIPSGGTIVWDDDAMVCRLVQTMMGDAGCGLDYEKPVVGDFKITVDYELGAIDAAKQGIGTGIKLFAKTSGPAAMAITLAHLQDAAGDEFYLVILRPSDGTNRRFRKFPVSKSLQPRSLVLSRVGTQLIYAVGESPGNVRELFRTYIEPDAITALRVVNSTSGVSNSEVKLRRLAIHSNATADVPSVAGSNLAIVTVMLLAGAISVAVIILVVRRRRSPKRDAGELQNG